MKRSIGSRRRGGASSPSAVGLISGRKRSSSAHPTGIFWVMKRSIGSSRSAVASSTRLMALPLAPLLPLLEALRAPRLFLLAPAPGRGARPPAVPAEAVFEPPRRLARVGEDQDPGPALALQEAPAAAEILPPAVV